MIYSPIKNNPIDDSIAAAMADARPLRGWMVLRLCQPASHSPGGIVIPEIAQDELTPVAVGVVLAMGPPTPPDTSDPDNLGAVMPEELPSLGAKVVVKANFTSAEKRSVVFVRQNSLLAVIVEGEADYA